MLFRISLEVVEGLFIDGGALTSSFWSILFGSGSLGSGGGSFCSFWTTCLVILIESGGVAASNIWSWVLFGGGGGWRVVGVFFAFPSEPCAW